MKSNESVSLRWARIIQQQEGSGLSIAEFCRRRDVPPPSFFAWRRRLRAGAPPAPGFVELKVTEAQGQDGAADGGSALELLLSGGRFRGRVLVRRGFDAQALRELLAALEAWA
jgi:hypothetical protein